MSLPYRSVINAKRTALRRRLAELVMRQAWDKGPQPVTIPHVVILVALLFEVAQGAGGEGSASWTPELTVQVQRIGAVVPSPDGKLVAYTQSRAVIEVEKSETSTQLFLAKTDGSWRRQLTRGEKSANLPAFSPDSRFVYFISARSGTENLWRIPVDGGEAEMITEVKDGIGAYRLSPDGKSIVLIRVKTSGDEEMRKREKLDFRVVDDSPRHSSLWLVPVEASSDRKRMPKKILEAPFRIGSLDWSPDSKYIAFGGHTAPDPDWKESDISEVNVATGRVRLLAGTPAAEATPLYSPDGRYLAFIQSSVPARWAGAGRIVVLPRKGGEPRTLPPTYDEWPTLIGWTGDSRRILFTEQKSVQRILAAMPMDGLPTVVYGPERGSVNGAWIGGNGSLVGLSLEGSSAAPEGFVLPLSGGSPVRVSRANDDLPSAPLGETRVIKWKSIDDLEIEGLLTLPVGYEPTKRYPLVLIIHGGPAGSFEDLFIGWPANPGVYPLAVFAAKGYVVLRPNIRGSSGRGKPFRFANIGDWGGKDYEDLMAGVDHVIAMGVADPDRLAVMGSSYGGYMTDWVIGHTKRFKAAAAYASPTNLWSFTGSTDITNFLPDWFGGEPWQNFEAYRKHSPMSYVDRIETPLLICHGENDFRVPVSQAFELYNALKRRGVPTKMVIYPRTGHGDPEPKLLVDFMHRHLDWLDTYLR